MAAPIGPIAAYQAQVTSTSTASTKSADGADFGNLLSDALQDASASEKRAGELSDRFGKGDPSVGIHEVMIASEKANIQLRYAVALKNKILDAYRQLMNTQV